MLLKFFLAIHGAEIVCLAGIPCLRGGFGFVNRDAADRVTGIDRSSVRVVFESVWLVHGRLRRSTGKPGAKPVGWPEKLAAVLLPDKARRPHRSPVLSWTQWIT